MTSDTPRDLQMHPAEGGFRVVGQVDRAASYIREGFEGEPR